MEIVGIVVAALTGSVTGSLVMARAARVLNRTPKMNPSAIDTTQMHINCFGCSKDMWIKINNGDVKQFLIISLNDYLCRDCEKRLSDG